MATKSFSRDVTIDTEDIERAEKNNKSATAYHSKATELSDAKLKELIMKKVGTFGN